MQPKVLLKARRLKLWNKTKTCSTDTSKELLLISLEILIPLIQCVYEFYSYI